MSGMGIIRFDVAAAKRNRRAKMSDTAIVSEQSGETRSRGSGAGFGGGLHNYGKGGMMGLRQGGIVPVRHRGRYENIKADF